MEGVQLSREAVRQIRDLMREVKELRREVERLSGRKSPRRLVDDLRLAKNGGSSIAARSGTSVSSGTVTLQHVDDSNQVTADDREVSAKNWSSTAIAANAYCWLGRCSRTGQWHVIAVDC